MTYISRHSFDEGSRGLPPFDELRPEQRAEFVVQYFRPGNEGVAQVILDDAEAMRIVREAYRAVQRDSTQEPQSRFIDRLDARVRKLAEERRDTPGGYKRYR